MGCLSPVCKAGTGCVCLASNLLTPLQKDAVYLNLVLDYVPETVYRVARHYSRAKQTLPMVFVKVGNTVGGGGGWWRKLRVVGLF